MANQEALTDAYNMFTSTGYNGTEQDFSELLKSNPDALKDSHTMFTDTGYNGSENDFKSLLGLTPTQQEDFPAEPEEVKGDPSQEDVAVEGEDGASNGEESSSESQETEEDIRFNEVLAEIEKEQLTEEEVLEAETNANNVVDYDVNDDGGFADISDPDYMSSFNTQSDQMSNINAQISQGIEIEEPAENEPLIVNGKNIKIDESTLDDQAEEKKQAKQILEFQNKSLPEDQQIPITDEAITEQARKQLQQKNKDAKFVEKLTDNVDFELIGLDPDQKRKIKEARSLQEKSKKDLENNIKVNKDSQEKLKTLETRANNLKNKPELKAAKKSLEATQRAYEANPTEETQAAYTSAYDNYKTVVDGINAEHGGIKELYNKYYNAYTTTHDNHAKLVKTDKDLALYLDAYGRDNSLLWGKTTGKLVVTLGEMGIGALELLDKISLPVLIQQGIKQVEGEWGYDLGENGDALEAGLTYYNNHVKPLFGGTTVEGRRKARAYLKQAREGLAIAPAFGEIQGLGDFGNYIADLAFNQAPNLALMYYTGGASLYAMGAVAAGQKFGEYEDLMHETGIKISPLQMYTAATLTGVTEALSEYITLGQIGQFKTAIAGGSSLKAGFINYLTKQLFSSAGIFNTLSDAAQEGTSEMVAQLSSNYLDNAIGVERNPLEGVKESFWSGAMMSMMLFKAPVVGRNLYNAIEGKDANQKIGEKQARLKELGALLNNPDLTPGLKEKYIAEHQKVVKDINSIQQDEISKLDEMSNTEKKTILDVARKKYDLRKQQDEIANSNLDAETKASEIQNIKNEISKLDVKKNELMAPYYLEDTIDEIRIQADAIGGATGKTAKVTPMNAEEIAESLLAEQARIREDIAYQEQFLGTQDDAMAKGNIEYFENELAALEQADNQFGYISPQEDGGFEVIINKDKPMMGTAAHELMHAVLFKSIQQDPSIQDVMGDALMDHVASLGGNSSVIGRRMEAYGRWAKDKDGNDIFVRDSNFGEEAITVISEGIYDGTLDYNESFFNKVGNVVRRTLQDKLGRKVSFNTGRDVYNFIKDFNKSLKDKKVNRAIIRTAAEGAGGRLVENKAAVEATKQMSKDARAKTPEQLVKTIKRGGNQRQVAAAEDVLVPQYQALALQALGYTEAKGDILRKNVVSAVNDYYDAIIRNYDPKKGKFSTHVYNNIAPKNDTIFEKAKTLAKRDESVSMDAPEARQVAGDAGTTTNLEDTFVQKIDILGFATVGRVVDKIRDLVKVRRGDTFKEIISRYAGKVGELVFDIPAKKIMEGGANLAAVTKYKEGMPVPAEAQNIQRFFNAGQNAERFIKTLPLYNITDKNADIDKVGENIDVSRNAYGIAIGLKGLPLDYFYENYTDPKSISKDPKVRAESITSPAGRSKGLTSQTQVKRLKPEFRNPTPEVVEQFKQDIGITPKGQENVYNRDIGQLLKGAAKVYAINASLSTAQRAQEAKLKAAPATEQKAIKQQTADITAAQSKIAFSKDGEVDLDNNTEKLNKTLNNSDNIIEAREEAGNIDPEFIDKENRDNLNKNLAFHGLKPMHTYDSATNIDFIINGFKRISTILNQETANYTIFFKSDRHIPASVRKNLIVDPKTGKKIMVRDYYKREIKKAFPPKTTYGKQFTGPASKYKKGKKFGKLYGKTPADFRAAMKKGRNYEGSGKNAIKLTIPEINEMHESMGTQLWQRINDDINGPNGNRENARIWANYLAMATNNTEHPHRQWAEFIGWTKNPLGSNEKGNTDPNSKGYKVYEWEHAMQSAKSINYLMHSILGGYNFDAAFELIRRNYKLIALDNYDDKVKLKGAKRTHSMGDGWSVLDAFHKRYQDEVVAAVKGKNGNGINPEGIETIFDGKTMGENYNINTEGQPREVKPNIKQTHAFSKAINKSRTVNPAKGITVLDFDDTLATSKSLVISTSSDGVVRKLTAEEFAQEGADLLDQGWTHDFSEFSKVVDGKVASLFNKAMKLQGKFGPENMFVLTARPADSAPAIFEFLQANGLNIPLENITGLANSTSEAKALWIAEKVADGYNDFYFADDALQNVQAVQNMLDQFDVKSKVQQAKVQFSKDASQTFNNILESTTGVESIKEFSNAQAKLRGQKTKYKSIIPASAQDFQGLLYNFLGKGKKGEADMAFFKKALIDPFARGINELNASRQSAANDFENLNKKFPDVKKKLNDNIEGLDYTNDQAMRVYLWNKAGFEVPGLSKRDLAALTSFIENNPEMKAYADAIGLISKKEDGYSKPKDYWLAENIASDLLSDGAIGDKRSDFLAEWIQNKDMIFSPENLNKIEAIYGSKFREALEDMLYRMETGRNRPTGNSRLVNGYMNWVNNSVGAIMFLNLRSATLQTISATNYINWTDNNPLKAGMAFANQKQFWSDFSMIWNSPYLKQRRAGNQRGINEAELSAAVAGSDNKAKAAIAWLLKKGFTPTQIADSFAISIGGASMLRNRIKTYIKEGMSQKDAEAKAWLDFQETTEVNQQSARPDMISQQQASPLGRLILAFQNTPMQYARIMNKATRDLANGRGDYKAHISKIAYYGVVQSIIFGALQSALYASLGDDDEEDFDKKKERILNQMVDSWLTGIGVGGKAVSTVKNTLMEYFEQRDKGFNSDHAYTLLTILSFSPPIGSKLRKIYSSIQTEQFNRGVFSKRGFTLDNPIWSGVGNVIEGVTNIPLGRMSNLMLQLDNAMDPAHKWWQRVALLLGQNTWDLGIKDPDIEAAKDEVKEEKKIESKKRAKVKREQKKKEKEEENKVVIEENKKKSKKDGICSAVSKGGKRCKTKVVEGKLFCTVHESTTKRSDGKEVQCRKRKSDGKRCKMKTTNKSGYCYYHD